LALAFNRNAEAVHKNLLAAKVSSQADEISLIRPDADQLVLSEESFEGVVLFAALAARFDGEAHAPPIIESETEHRVRDRGASPVHLKEIDIREARQFECFIAVTKIEVALAAIRTAADVVDGDSIAIALRPRQYRHLRAPVAVVRGPLRGKDKQTHRKDAKQQQCRPPQTRRSPQQNDGRDDHDG